MPFVITNINKWPITIPDASNNVAGVIKLSDIPAHAGTLSTIYDNGRVSADQTINISPAKGGPIVIQALNPTAGTLLSVAKSVGTEILGVVDAGLGVIAVEAAGTFIRLDGWSVMGSQTPNGRVSYSSDGQGAAFAGTSMTPRQNGADSTIDFALNDVPDYQMNKFGMTLPAAKGVGVDSGGAPSPNVFMASKFFTSTNGGLLSIVGNTIAPTASVHHVGAGLLSTITPPFAGFIGTIALIPDAAFDYNNAGNITPPSAGPDKAVVGQMFATYDGTKWFMSY